MARKKYPKKTQLTLDVLFKRPNSKAAALTIRRFRDSWDMTQKQFAEVLGVQPETVSRWETGVYRIQKSCATCLKYWIMLKENHLL